MADIIEIQLYLLAVVVLTLVSICAYRVKKNFKTERRNSTIFFLSIWAFAIIVVVFGLAGKYAPYASQLAAILLRIGDSFSIVVLLSMTFFANSILFGTIYREKKAKIITLYVVVEAIVILILFWVMPVSFLPAVTYNEITYGLNELITIAYFPLIAPILYVFIKMERIDPGNKWKYRLYLAGFIGAIVELAFDMPGTLPELLFVWRCFALGGMALIIIALLLPRSD
ncbi:MAG: hypothetical protein ACFFD2_04290 [Promethearchaeota archaeon]